GTRGAQMARPAAQPGQASGDIQGGSADRRQGFSIARGAEVVRRANGTRRGGEAEFQEISTVHGRYLQAPITKRCRATRGTHFPHGTEDEPTPSPSPSPKQRGGGRGSALALPPRRAEGAEGRLISHRPYARWRPS